MKHLDMVVIGSGPAGQKAAIQAAKLGKHVALIEKAQVPGGTCINTGTIPSKALREAVYHLTGIGHRRLYGESYTVKQDVTLEDLIYRGQQVIRTEIEVIRRHMARNGVEMLDGQAAFVDEHTVRVERAHTHETLGADFIVVATGTSPARPATIPFDGANVVDSDGLLCLPRLPKSMIIVGGGVVGTEYACMMSALDVRVILVEARDRLLDFADAEITMSLEYHMRSSGITLRMGERVEGIQVKSDGVVEATLQSGKHLVAETLLYCIGRQGSTEGLNLEKIGVAPDDRGRIAVNEHYQTAIPHIYAVGDVVGFPALASTSMEQGRLASCHAFGEPVTSFSGLFPFGVYSIPEISMVGRTEEQLTREGVPYEAGIAQYREIARGQLIGDEAGMLKLLIHEDDRRILGVHAIGTGATELIHIGQAVMSYNGTVDYFVNNVFNYPTLAECYKVAALNGSNKLRLNLRSLPAAA
jgi:NAD(P) transhydrogenase